ncbi:MAG TPA: adenylate/guanylate cyclase domain-containing protein [Mycobacteriales bacterium]|nr:adenylate/guanylate cyclase domain-containing protein [Mycobacteriales bacterium]
MSRVRDPSHAQRLFGLLFASEETERQYQEWRIAHGTPFARIGYIGSVPTWTLVLVAVVTLDREAAHEAAGWVAGWIVLLLVLTALTVPTALRRTVMPLAAAANCAAGFLIVWLVSDVLLSTARSQSRAGVMTAGLIVVMFFGLAIFRIPPRAAVASVTPYVAFGSYQLYESNQRGELQDVEATSLVAAQWIAYLGCLLVCVVIEIVDRRTFVKDQIIDAQQQELHTSRETIRRYVPRAVSERIVSGDTAGIDTPARRLVTVLLADLVGFTALAESVEAEVLTRVANDYMTAMSELVDEHGGIVNEFAGDGLMALFGAPDQLALLDQAVCAIRAAQAMQDRLPELNPPWVQVGVRDPVQMRIGISTGVLSVGSFGSEGRMTYTAIGLHTNIAARLEAHCEAGGILMSESTWELAKEHIACEPRGEVQCKGVRDPVRVYAPLPQQHPVADATAAAERS